MRRIYITIIILTAGISLWGQHSTESILRAVENQGVALAAARSTVSGSAPGRPSPSRQGMALCGLPVAKAKGTPGPSSIRDKET